MTPSADPPPAGGKTAAVPLRYDAAEWPDEPVPPDVMQDGLPVLRADYPELADWPDGALVEAWTAFCTDGWWASWIAPYRTTAFLGYLVLSGERALPDEITMFHEHHVFEEAATRVLGL